MCITYPEILEMQVRAIIEAAINCTARGINVQPEVMIPLSIDPNELAILVARVRQVADSIFRERKTKLNYLVGTMVETPRAALLAGRMAEVAEFFSFGTNDLTQLTMALSRDDAGRFLPEYVDQDKAAILPGHPFHSIDVDGVGRLLQIACQEGRETRKDLKLGICGEHGGEPASIRFCEQIGLDYVSCSPFRVPIARLATAKAAIGDARARPRTTSTKPHAARPQPKMKAKTTVKKAKRAKKSPAKKTVKKKTIGKKSKNKTAGRTLKKNPRTAREEGAKTAARKRKAGLRSS
jgi:pyruvate,orthophosphate dikinase